MNEIFFQRLNQYVESKGISNNEFAKKIDVSSAQMSHMLNGKNFGIDKLLKIFSVFEELNTNWLITGNGTMLKEEKVEDLSLEVLAKERCENCNTLERLIKNQDERIKELKDTIEILKKK